MNLELVDSNEVKKKCNVKYKRELLIEKIQQFVKANGRLPTEYDFNKDPKYPHYATYQREFGSWNNALAMAGYKLNDHITRARQGEIQTISEFKTEGMIDLSGQNRNSTCDGICPQGEMFDTKSSSLIKLHGYWGWGFNVTISQLEEADYLFLRAYKDKDFTKKPLHIWRVPIEFIDNRAKIFIYKDNRLDLYNVDNMKKYEVMV